MQQPVETLSRHRAEIWLARPPEIGDPQLLEHYRSLLCPAERARERAFLQAADRRAYLITHALLRTVLSRYCPRRPADWVFHTNPHGRPELAPGQTSLPIDFNLAHTRGLVACALTLGHAIGIDCECTDRPAPLEVAEHFFSPTEAADLARAPARARDRRFFAYWTLKEAYSKARGLGLCLPLHAYSFDLDDPQGPRIAIDPALHDHPAHWQFHLAAEDPDHLLAIAVKRGQGADLEIRTHRIATRRP